jgi:hypothetical protein
MATVSPIPLKQFKALPKSVQEVLVAARVPIHSSSTIKRRANDLTAPPDTIALRWDWGDGWGLIEHDLHFDGWGMTSASLAFASTSECVAGGISQGTHLGDAYFHVYNVAVHDTNVVSVRIHVDYFTNLRICIDYFVVIDPTPYTIEN